MMKTIGLIGGMSWESTIPYYRIINQTVKERLGGFHSAKILLYSVDFAEIEACQTSGDWDQSAAILSKAAQKLEQGGADFIVICTNTMHKIAPAMQSQLHIPILHIAEATADALIAASIYKVALLGTKYTMTQDFYKQKLENRGIQVLVPAAEDVELCNRVIYEELCQGIVAADSRAQYLRMIDRLAANGAQGVILGCTEIGLLITQRDVTLPVFDTTLIHAQRAASFALDETGI